MNFIHTTLKPNATHWG